MDYSRVFYHITPKENEHDILKRGILPGKYVNKNNIWLGMKGDPDYIYLFSSHDRNLRSMVPRLIAYSIYNFLYENITRRKTKRFAIPGRFSVLKVTLPDDFFVERDYDQIYVILKNKGHEQAAEKLKYILSKNILPDNLTKENIKKCVDGVPEIVWDDKIGSYRTPHDISNKYVSKSSWLNLYRGK